MSTNDTNRLFPIFLKIEQLRVLLVGGGNVGLEKLSAILNNAPSTQVIIISIHVCEGIKQLAATYENVYVHERSFDDADIVHADLVFVAVNDLAVSSHIRTIAKAAGKLVNVADTPSQCDFYLGSIVQKGNLKIGISTNGKSPTAAKRLKEVLHDALPCEIDELLLNLQEIRNSLAGDFAGKVKTLNELTQSLVNQ